MIEISKTDYRDMMSLIGRAADIICGYSPPPREYNVARRLRVLRKKIMKRNALNI